MARGLVSAYHNCHTPGALCGHANYVDLIPPIMGDKNYDRDSWAARMEQQLKAHFDVAPSEIHVAQIHCGDIGCLIDLTQENGNRTFQEQTASDEEGASLTNESWFKQQFFASYDDSPFSGSVTVSDDQNTYEALWIFARKLEAAPASSP